MKKLLTILVWVGAQVAISQNAKIDSTFANNGIFKLGNPSTSAGTDILPSKDGNYLVLATGFSILEDCKIYKLNSTGQLVNAFGNAGVFTKNFKSYTVRNQNIVEDNNGNIYCALLVKHTSNLSLFDSLAIIKINNSGTADISFGKNGIVYFKLHWENIAQTKTSKSLQIALQSTGKIVLAGPFVRATKDCNLIRLKPNGQMDSTFAVNGWFSLGFNANSSSMQLGIKSDNKIVTCFKGDSGLYALQLTENGALDINFGKSGKTKLTANSMNFVGLQLINKQQLLVCASENSGQMKLFQLTATGQWDNNFGTNGISSQVFGNPNCLAEGKNGSFFIGGYVGYYWKISRYKPNGQLDSSFGGGQTNNGTYIETTIGIQNSCYKILAESNGNLICTGTSNKQGTFEEFCVVRFSNANTYLKVNAVNAEKVQIKIMENPFENVLNITTSNSNKKQYCIKSLDAKILIQFSSESNTIAISTAFLKSGIYLLEVKEGSRNLDVIRLVKR